MPDYIHIVGRLRTSPRYPQLSIKNTCCMKSPTTLHCFPTLLPNDIVVLLEQTSFPHEICCFLCARGHRWPIHSGPSQRDPVLEDLVSDGSVLDDPVLSQMTTDGNSHANRLPPTIFKSEHRENSFLSSFSPAMV